MNTHDDLGDSLKITKTEGRQLNAPGTWVSGSIAGHTFQVLVFEDHAENADYELGTSRISKLQPAAFGPPRPHFWPDRQAPHRPSRLPAYRRNQLPHGFPRRKSLASPLILRILSPVGPHRPPQPPQKTDRTPHAALTQRTTR